MKYANYMLRDNGTRYIGDCMQIIATDNLYHLMKVPKEEIVYIKTDELATYSGEKVILPISFPLMDYCEGGIARRFSPQIEPVFLCFTMIKSSLSGEEIEYLKRYEPIGCRDEGTMKTLQMYGIDSYLHGCITMTLPLRENTPHNGKPYIVDVSKEGMDIIPEKIRNDAIYRSHINCEIMDRNPIDITVNQLREYKENASLVITSLLHCASPCMAMGIPVIIIKDIASYRFGWIDKWTDIYTPDKYSLIDWNPNPIENEDYKSLSLKIAMDRLMGKVVRQDCDKISSYLLNREKRDYFYEATLSLERYVDCHFKKNEKKAYSVWGLTQEAERIVDYIEQNYPKALLSHVYDISKRTVFHGINSEIPCRENMQKSLNEVVLVTAVGARASAELLFESIDKPKSSYAFREVVM